MGFCISLQICGNRDPHASIDILADDPRGRESIQKSVNRMVLTSVPTHSSVE